MTESKDIEMRSEFNDAFGLIARIDRQLVSCEISRVNYDVNSWIANLISLYAELECDMKKEEKDTCDELMSLHDIIKKTNSTQRDGRKFIAPDMYKKLFNIEIALRKVYDRTGLRVKKRDLRMMN